MTDALMRSGAKILRPPDPKQAPFTYEILKPDGERLRLAVYLFTANKYMQENRPKDENRYQIKYGSDFHEDDYHEFYVPRSSNEVTLLLGVHLAEGIFVAADPAMHNPTRFSVSIAFKDHHIAEVKARGWYGWEKERRAGGRRKKEMPLDSHTTEVLLGFTPEHMLRYIELERSASGLEPGHRLLLIDRLVSVREVGDVEEARAIIHALEEELGLTPAQIMELIEGRNRLKVAVRGAAAEFHLERHIRSIPGMDVERLDADGRPDFLVSYRGGPERLIECKLVLRRSPASCFARVDFQRTRAAKGNPCSRYYSPDEFHILAACLHPVVEEWQFVFAPTVELPPHPNCRGRITHKVDVANEHPWVTSVTNLL